VSYENPDVPHEVNVTRENAPIEFLRLLAGIGLCVVLAAAVLFFAGGWLARLVPFTTEREWVGDRVLGFDVAPFEASDSPAIERYVKTLGNELAGHMELPADMAVSFHYAELDVPNAFATLGGHIVVTRALYRRMPSENALAMVLAHEIAHVKARDPIAAVGGSASVALVLALLGGGSDGLAPQLAALVQLGYSRRAETRADDEALAALAARYGHAGGAASVFRVLAQDSGTPALPAFLSTHPADGDRIARLERAAASWEENAQPLEPLGPRDP
jgi:predicted Zn-dependent protease